MAKVTRGQNSTGSVNKISNSTKGRVGNTNPNQRAVLNFKPVPRPTVRRALSPTQFVTLQAKNPPAGLVTIDKPSITKNTFYQAGRPVVRARAAVRRLFRKDPYNIWSATAPPPFGTGATVAQFSPEAEQVDVANPNTFFHPEKSPGAVSVMRYPQAVAGKKNHGSYFPPNRQTLFGGKTLRRV